MRLVLERPARVSLTPGQQSGKAATSVDPIDSSTCTKQHLVVQGRAVEWVGDGDDAILF
jgi:hypothetical protein